MLLTAHNNPRNEEEIFDKLYKIKTLTHLNVRKNTIFRWRRKY